MFFFIHCYKLVPVVAGEAFDCRVYVLMGVQIMKRTRMHRARLKAQKVASRLQQSMLLQYERELAYLYGSSSRGDTETLMALENRLQWAEDDDDICDRCCCVLDENEDPVCCCFAPCLSNASPKNNKVSLGRFLLSRPGRIILVCTSMIIIYIFYLVVTQARDAQSAFGEEAAPRTGVNTSRAREVLSALCDSYDRQEVSGDACNRLCYSREWQVADFYENNKVVVVIKDGGQQAVFKSLHPFIEQYQQPEETNDKEFVNQVLEKTNEELMLGWPSDLTDHLVGVLWPSVLRSNGQKLSAADRRSLWALMQQPEYLTFRILPLSRVTPKVIGSCGHMYEVESLVAFRMKGYYMNLKGKILVHLMGTLKLFYEFLNEPLQWCDVRFENLGLSAEYPKRFVLMDGDMVYTESRLRKLLTAKSCQTDADCAIGDCSSRCQADYKCSPRSNENLDVFCDKLVNKLFGNTWSKSNKYLNACHDTATNFTTKLNDLRLTWSWTLSDV